MRGKVFLVLIAALGLLRLSAAAGADRPASARWALLIGAEDYVELEKLRYCAADMRALRDRLVASGFPERQIYLLEDKVPEKKYLPFKSAIERQLDLVLKMVDREDLLVVAFSGHGAHIDGKSYLCPLDARLSDPLTMIPLDGIYQRLQECPAALKVLLVDACRDDPRPGGSRSAGPAPQSRELAESLERPPRGIYCLTSCAPGETSKEDPALRHGVFMNFVLEGLGGAADVDHRGKVSLLELCRYATKETKLYVSRKYNESQRPSYKVDATDDFDLVRSVIAEKQITNSVGMKLTLVPAGEFMMGSVESAEATADYFKTNYQSDLKADSYKDEHPQHRVRITRPFYLGTYHATRGQFRQFVEATDYKTDGEKDGKGAWGYNGEKFEQKPEYTWRNAGFEQSDEHPVVNVSWNDAMAFCQWLSGKEGKSYRLPSEAEWEYACRAGTTTRYNSGDDPETLAQVGNVADATFKAKFTGAKGTINGSDGFVFTAPVGSFRPNAFGLYDMHGNAWQWCADWYGAEYYATSPANNPTGPDSGNDRVLRGGSWGYWPGNARSATRDWNTPGDRGFGAGFRVSRTN